ncbi:MAG TPA: hypothetical protein VL523_16970 [Terriglobia bacterium]|nr:hypothetical protein [Terriglobia bacterium]
MTLEEAGRAADRELENLKRWVNRELEPSTRKEMAEGLRKVAKHLSQLADRLQPPKR